MKHGVLHAKTKKSKKEKNMSCGFVAERVTCDEHPYAVDAVLALQNFVPSYLRESEMCIVAHLKNPMVINMFLKSESHEILAYAAAFPQNETLVKEFEIDDPLMPVDPDRYYIDQVVAKESARRGVATFAAIVNSVFAQANSMGFFKFSVHGLCENGVDRAIARVFRKHIDVKRPIVMPSYGNASYMYMEAYVDTLQVN